MRTALSERDMGAVVRIFRRWTGASQADVQRCLPASLAKPT